MFILNKHIHISARCPRSDRVFDIQPLLKKVVLKLWLPLKAEHLNTRGAFGLMHGSFGLTVPPRSGDACEGSGALFVAAGNCGPSAVKSSLVYSETPPARF